MNFYSDRFSDLVFLALFQIVRVYLNRCVLNELLLPKKIARWKENLTLILSWIIPALSVFVLKNRIGLACAIFVSLIVLAFGLYQGGGLKKFVTGLIAFGIIDLSTELLWLAGSALRIGLQESRREALCSFLTAVITIAVLWALKYRSDGIHEYELPASCYVVIIMTVLCSICMGFILATQKALPNYYTIAGFLLLTVIDVGICYLYARVQRAYESELDRVVLEKQVERYAYQLELNEEHQKKVSILKHDMKNHLLLIEHYLNGNQVREAEDYIAKMVGELKPEQMIANSGNTTVDSVINYLLADLPKQGCEVDISLKIPKDPFMSEYDLNAILGNLLENAVEAVSTARKKILSLDMQLQKGVLKLVLCNTFHGERIVEKQGYRTTKAEKQGHGVGLKSVEAIVEKYDGAIQIKTENQMFEVNLVLYIANND